jgi:GMP synthase-like glutamine amidotransferase
VFLAFRHIPGDTLGRISDSLDAPCQFADPRGRVDLLKAKGLIFLGGDMSANDDLDFIQAGIALIREAIAREIPVLGICLGAQLIAKALGARVYANPVAEIGWGAVRWTEAAGSMGLRGSNAVFQWHRETFDLPAGAELLATSDVCRNQAFRAAGGRVLALQFHLEARPERIAAWIEQDRNSAHRELPEPMDPNAHAERLREVAARLFGAWRDLAG